MEGFEPQAYGDAIADVYDAWYADVSDVESTVASLASLARTTAGGSGRVLELGVGTGRLAIPLAALGFTVVGIDVSAAMVHRLTQKPGGERVEVLIGDMAEDLPPGPFAVVYVAFNTFFSLTSAEAQAGCFRAVASRLAPDGAFALEAFVPDDQIVGGGDRIEVRTLTADRVVLTISRHDDATQQAEGQFVELTEAGGVRLRPWSLRYAPPGELDAMASAAGLELGARWSSWDQTPFTDASPQHVSLYRHMPAQHH